MRPAGPRVPDALLLLLLLGPLATRGDCNIPPEVPNSQPQLQGLSSFPEKTSVTYKCDPGFVKVPGLPDSTLCENGQWSEVAEFCNRSCDVPTRLLFAALQKPYSEQNYFPAGTVVEYECRQGFYRDESLSRKLTCLQNFKWSEAEEFCKRESCPDPGEIKNGHVSVTIDILYGSSITFSCNAGYRLVGEDSSYCILIKGKVGWSDPLPECKEMVCPEPPKIEHGMIQDPQNIYLYNQSVRYECDKGFALIGKNSIHCAVKDTQLAWSSPHPVCRATQRPAAPRATTRMQATTAPARGPPFSRASIITFGCVAGMVIIGTLILVKIFWHYGKSGSYYTRENGKTLNATFHSFPVTGDDSEAGPSGKPRKDTNA